MTFVRLQTDDVSQLPEGNFTEANLAFEQVTVAKSASTSRRYPKLETILPRWRRSLVLDNDIAANLNAIVVACSGGIFRDSRTCVGNLRRDIAGVLTLMLRRGSALRHSFGPSSALSPKFTRGVCHGFSEGSPSRPGRSTLRNSGQPCRNATDSRASRLSLSA